jgi:hypothetical protein
MKLAVRLALVLLAAFLFGCGLVREPGAKPTGSLQDLQGVAQLQAMFNQDTGDTRLILLVSPT